MSDSTESPFDVFLSYASADRAWVHGYLIPALAVPREHCMTHDDFHLGATRVSEIERAIKSSRYTVLIFSPAYLADEWLNLSEQFASFLTTAEQSVRVIPLLRSECELPLHIDFRVRLDCTEQANWERETARLRDLLKQPKPQPEIITCPYPGMIPFGEKDSALYFGRESDVEQLVQQLRLHPFQSVIGHSGSGKSSLIFAGLWPALRKTTLFGSDKWQMFLLRPGKKPLDELTAFFKVDVTETKKAISTLTESLQMLVVVDQFEEIFAATREDALLFQKTLQDIAKVLNCYVVLTVRADYYPDLMESPLWKEIQAHRVEIPPLDGDRLREAIIRPAETRGVFVDPVLVERLVADAAGEYGILPFVQETLVLLWEHRQLRFLSATAYESLAQSSVSSPQTSIKQTGLQVAMSRRADTVFAQLSESQQMIARRIFLRLVQFGEGHADNRRQQPVSALRASSDDAGEFDRTIKHLTDNRLLTSSGEERDRERKIDIAHDALITGWNRLREWVNERREAEQTRRRLESKASEWERLGRGDAGLLDPIELSEAENWLKSADAQDLGYSKTLRNLIDISRKEIRKTSKRQQYFTIGLSVFLVIALIAAGFAFQQKWFADDQTKLATSRELAASAVAQLNSDPQIAALLAIQANQVAHTYESEDALRQAIRTLPIVTLLGHTRSVISAAWSRDGTQIVTASQDGTARVWDSASGRELANLRGHTGYVTGAAWSPDGKQIVTASLDSTARIWDVGSGRELTSLRGHTDVVRSAVFSPDGKQVVTASDDGTGRIWDAENGHELVNLRGGSFPFTSAQWSPDGKRILTASLDDTASIWDVESGREMATLHGHSFPVSAMEWSPDGKKMVTDPVITVAWSPDARQIATASWDNTARIWDAQNARELVVLRGHGAPVMDVAWSPDGTRIVTVSQDNTGRIWDIESGRELATLIGHTNFVSRVAWSPNGKQIVTASWDRTARVWDAASGREIATLRGHLFRVNSAAWSPDGRRIVTSSPDPNAFVWDAESGGELVTLRGHSDSVWIASWSPNGKQIATTSQDQTARVWDVVTGRELATWRDYASDLTGGQVNPASMMIGAKLFFMALWSPNGKQILTASGDGTARVWDATSGRETATLRGHKAAILDAAWKPDGSQIATASRDNTARIWDAVSGDELVTLPNHTSWVYNATWSSDGQKIVTASLDNTARIWDASSGRELAILRGHTSAVKSALFSPDDSQVLTASQDNTARVWDSSGRELTMLLGHRYSVWYATWSPNGKQIVTTSNDSTVRIWDAKSGREIASLVGVAASNVIASWSPNGQEILTTGDDNTARIWAATTGLELAALRGHKAYVTNAAWSPDGREIVTTSQDGTARIYLTKVEDLISLAKSRVSRALDCEEREKYLHEPRCPTPTPRP